MIGWGWYYLGCLLAFISGGCCGILYMRRVWYPNRTERHVVPNDVVRVSFLDGHSEFVVVESIHEPGPDLRVVRGDDEGA